MLLASLTLNAVLLLAIAWRLLTRRRPRKPKAHQLVIADRHALEPRGADNIVFAGDSLIDLMPLHLLTPLRNRGIGGETVDEVARRLPEILRGCPSRLILLAGTPRLPAGPHPGQLPCAAGCHRRTIPGHAR